MPAYIDKKIKHVLFISCRSSQPAGSPDVSFVRTPQGFWQSLGHDGCPVKLGLTSGDSMDPAFAKASKTSSDLNIFLSTINFDRVWSSTGWWTEWILIYLSLHSLVDFLMVKLLKKVFLVTPFPSFVNFDVKTGGGRMQTYYKNITR